MKDSRFHKIEIRVKTWETSRKELATKVAVRLEAGRPHLCSWGTSFFYNLTNRLCPRHAKATFGYQDGTFIGARPGSSRGLVREADQGTLFLDEIGDNTRLNPLLDGLRLRG